MSLLISLLIASASIGVSSLCLEVPKDNIEIIQDFSGNTFLKRSYLFLWNLY